MSIPIEKWGRDHWSTFAFICATVVGRSGQPDRDRMRCDFDRHPSLLGPIMSRSGCASKKYPTRLLGDELVNDHDDWDIAIDCEVAGLIKDIGTGLSPIWLLTNKGWYYCKAIVMFKCYGGNFSEFKYDVVNEWNLKAEGL